MSNIITKNLGVVSAVPKGEYDATVYYEKLNMVQYNGSTYMAIQPSTGILPTNTSYWQFVAGGLRVEDIVDNLESTATNKPLSAKQGKVLNNKIKITNISSLAKLENICALPYRYSGATDLQGGCYGGDGKVVNYFTSSHTIQVIDLLTGSVDREYSDNNFGHGNGICKIDDFIYLCGTGNMSTNNVYKIPYNTLDSYEIINVYGENLIPSGNISCIAYNPDNEKVYISIAPVFDTMTIYEFNKELSKVENIYTIENGNKYGGFITNICYWKEFLLVHYNYGKLQLFNIDDMSLYKTIDLDMYVGTRIASELEWLDNYEDGKLIIGTRAFVGNSYGSGGIFFAITDLTESSTEYPINTSKAATTDKNLLFSFNIYVDNTLQTTNLLRDGSQSNPFNNLYEALQCASNPRYKNINIYLRGDYSNDYLCICNTTNNVKILNWDNGNIINTKGFKIENTGRVTLQNITATNEVLIDNADVYLTFYNVTKTEHTYTLNCKLNSNLYISCREREVTLLGTSLGRIEFTNLNQENGIVSVLNSTADGYTNFIQCRNISNVMQRGRLSGSSYTPTTSMTFFLNLASVKNIWVQVGNNDYVSLPITNSYGDKTYTVPIPNSTPLSVKITQDNTSYENRIVWKYELEHDTLIIYDSLIIY